MSTKKWLIKSRKKTRGTEHTKPRQDSKRKHTIKVVGCVAIGVVVAPIIFCVGYEIWRLYHPETSAKIAWTRYNEIGTALQNAFDFKATEESSDSSGNYVKLESETGLSFYYYYIPGYFDISSQEWFQIQQGPKEQKYYNFGHILYKIYGDEIDEIAQKNNGYSSITKKSVEAPYHNEISFLSHNDKEAFLSDLFNIEDIQLTKKACEETLEKEESRNNYYRNGCSSMTPIRIDLGGGKSHDIWEQF